MSAPLHFFRETHLIGPDCRERSLDQAHHPVLQNTPFIWVGYSELQPPYCMVRLASVHSHVVACITGRGRALIDGEAMAWRPGQVLLAPVGAHHAFEITGNAPWKLAWVFFNDQPDAPAWPSTQATLREADAGDFIYLLQLLLRESAGAAQAEVLAAAGTLLTAATLRLVGSDPIDRRLHRLWNAVELDLARDWSVRTMARHIAVSEEHLRRLCHRHHRRSPAEHLTDLRMRRASTLLRASPSPVESIALAVGYASVYSFSVAFRRWSGQPPGRFRRG